MSTQNPYDKIGAGYSTHRKADPSVIVKLMELLSLPERSRIADIGAGTGNYAHALAKNDYFISAIEPSSVMRSQATFHKKVKWYDGCAEELPLEENSVDGTISILAIHHFRSFEAAAREMHRICNGGPIILLTLDPRKGERFWFKDYFPSIYKHLFKTFPPIESICASLERQAKGTAEIETYPLPQTTSDYTMHSGWNRPEIYLDPAYRQSMSGFPLASPEEVDPGVSDLGTDLDIGAWDRKYGKLRELESYDLGFRFIKLTVNK